MHSYYRWCFRQMHARYIIIALRVSYTYLYSYDFITTVQWNIWAMKQYYSLISCEKKIKGPILLVFDFKMRNTFKNVQFSNTHCKDNKWKISNFSSLLRNQCHSFSHENEMLHLLPEEKLLMCICFTFQINVFRTTIKLSFIFLFRWV